MKPIARVVLLCLPPVLLGAAWLATMLFNSEALPDPHDCSLHVDSHDTWFERDAAKYLAFRAGGAARSPIVKLVTITPDAEPQSIMTNTCEGRRFFTQLVPALDRLGPRVIAIDKVYGVNSCPDEAINAGFRNVLAATQAKVVVGQGTDRRPGRSTEENCMVLSPAFDFQKGLHSRPSQPHVQQGLTRMNEDLRKIPLGWAVLKSKQTPVNEAAKLPTFALQTAIAYQPQLSNNPHLQYTATQPYARALSESDEVSATAILCQDALSKKVVTWANCQSLSPTRLNLSGKILVVGERTDIDLQHTPVGDRYGFELQGSYIDALVRGLYVRTLYYWVDFTMAILFLGVTAYMTYKHSDDEPKALLWTGGLLVAFVILLLIFMRAGFFPPYSLFVAAASPVLFAISLLFYWLRKALGKVQLERRAHEQP